MELSISDDKTEEALEEIGLANAIAEGRKNEFVSEEEVFQTVMRHGALENSSPHAINSTGARP
ncbi:hypothetical protein [Candidatus Electronema sp. TJ]|uniref:hypothetical protein n=1 Tax=Candidatus Electronema sp. TJ TaxID=3401573 RepID=UPI003AA8174F